MTMNFKKTLLAATLLSLPMAATAQAQSWDPRVQGIYVGAGAGFNYLMGTDDGGVDVGFEWGYVGVISVGYVKDPLDPAWKDDEGNKRYLAFMDQYYPEGDKYSNLNVYGYITAQLLVHVLRRCGDDLTRKNVMAQASHLTHVDLDMLLPGISVTTTPTDYRVNKQFQMVQFDGQRWEKIGTIITDEGDGGTKLVEFLAAKKFV